MHIDWNGSYSVGVKRVDEQHKTIFTLINRLSDAISAKNAKEVLGSVLAELKTYTINHFKEEEELMKEWSYSGYLAHKAKHDKLIAKVDDLQERFSSDVKVLNAEVIGFLVSWLNDHIAVTDKKYGPFFNAMGIK